MTSTTMISAVALAVALATLPAHSANVEVTKDLTVTEKLIDQSWERPELLAELTVLLVDPNIPTEQQNLFLAQGVVDHIFAFLKSDSKRSAAYRKYTWMIYPNIAEYYFLIGEPQRALDLANESMAALPSSNKVLTPGKRIQKSIAKYRRAVMSLPLTPLGTPTQDVKADTCVDGLCEPSAARARQNDCVDSLTPERHSDDLHGATPHRSI